ncbi:MAG: circadian clock protein KaiA [Synechococcaceae cyanobacterium SM2_3_2]|nr:circadian clock protein KaiA [Synechococcaceae cyanobacterium SM2_3_2]
MNLSVPATKPLHVLLLQLWDFRSAQLPPDWHWVLPQERFRVEVAPSPDSFLRQVQQQSNDLDVLLLMGSQDDWGDLSGVAHQLCTWGILMPAVLVLLTHDAPESLLGKPEQSYYHNATVIRSVSWSDFAASIGDPAPVRDGRREAEGLGLVAWLDQAMARFLQLSPTCGLPEGSAIQGFRSIPDQIHAQQTRLAEKLREQLGYKGVYYHRDPQQFFRNMSRAEQQQLLHRLRGLYQAIVLDYFQAPQRANQRTDELVALAFFADMGASQILELHMSLMDDFAKQLKIEGRNEEILLDYRITLIDVISHLSEMYRRAIPRSPELSGQSAPPTVVRSDLSSSSL